jgi:hypothetical protein
MNYREAAEQFKAENPDGWYADPEAVLAMEEHCWEMEHVLGQSREEAVEWLREVWRKLNVKFQGGAMWAAGEMVEVEKLAAKMGASA